MATGAPTYSTFWRDPFRLVLWAIVIFPIHVLEETAGGFVGWFNGLVVPPISLSLFLTVNAVCFVVTAALAIVSARSGSARILSATVGWLLFLMLANGIFHIVGTIRFATYSPGTISAVLLYLPFSAALSVAAYRRGALQLGPFLTTLLLVGLPGAVHFYRILFEGRRLL